MDTHELRAIQAPLKQRYRTDPEAALVTLRAQGKLGDASLTCKVETGKALVACAGVTLKAVATALALPLRGGTVSAEGDLDFRGTLGVAKDVPVGFQAIRLRFEVDSDATAEQLDTLRQLTERYCVVYQTLQHGPAIGVSLVVRTPP